MNENKPDINQGGSWNEWSRHVLLEQERANEERTELKELVRTVTEAVHELEVTMTNAISKLEVKSGFWGAIGGLIPVGIAIAIYMIKNGK